MKKNIILSIALLFLSVNIPVYSFDFSYVIKPSNKREIISVLKNYDKAIKNHDVASVKSFYDDDYKSSDGFSMDDYIEMLKKTFFSVKQLNKLCTIP